MENAATVDAAGPVVTSNEAPGEIAEQPQPEGSAPSQGESPDERAEKSAVQKRFDKLVGQRLERDRRIADLERQLASREPAPQATQQQPKPAGDDAPKESDFTDYLEYVDARAEWKAKKAAAALIDERQAAQTRTQREAAANEELHTARTRFIAQAETIAADIPDFSDVAGPIDMSGVLGQALLQSDKGAAVAYFLGLNPSELERIEGIRNPVKAAMEIARLESKAEATLQTRTRSKASRQAAPLGSGGGGVRDDAITGKESMAEYARKYWERRRKGG